MNMNVSLSLGERGPGRGGRGGPWGGGWGGGGALNFPGPGSKTFQNERFRYEFPVGLASLHHPGLGVDNKINHIENDIKHEHEYCRGDPNFREARGRGPFFHLSQHVRFRVWGYGWFG